MRPYDLITFDCYGTLIDWEGGIRRDIARLGRELRRHLEPDVMARRYIQLELGLEQSGYRPYRDVLRLGLDALFRERGIELGPVRSRAFVRSIGSWAPFRETRPVLKALRGAGYKLAVLSNVDNDLLARSLKRIGVPVDFTVTAEKVRSYKPALRHWRAALEVSGVPKRRILHVAASGVHDIIPAATLGIPSAWIDRAGDGRVPGARPRHVFMDLRPLLPLLLPGSQPGVGPMPKGR